MKTRKTATGRTFHQENCVNKIRQQYLNEFGDRFILIGRHAWEWEVITEKHGKMSSMLFENRADATRHFENLVKQFMA